MAFWGEYVPVALRQARALKQLKKLFKKGAEPKPVQIEGKKIASSVWGKGWCDHLESFSDYSNRLPRGRAYVRNGSVCHLELKAGEISAYVAGSSLYKIHITVEPLKKSHWADIKKRCSGGIGSMLELLQGKLSREIMAVVADRESGLFPKPNDIKLSCSCPDWATMCKHVASVLYAVGNRLDHEPELLFLLRSVDAEELISSEIALPSDTKNLRDTLHAEDLSGIFGVDLELDPIPVPMSAPGLKKKRISKVSAALSSTMETLRKPTAQKRRKTAPPKAKAKAQPKAKATAKVKGAGSKVKAAAKTKPDPGASIAAPLRKKKSGPSQS